jgi:two-component system cell cycle response regulator
MVTVGAAVPGKYEGATHVARPIQWAAVLLALDAIFSADGLPAAALKSADAAVPLKQAGKINPNAENELELQQVEPWYDRSKPTVFQTAPAILVVDSDYDTVMDIAAELSGSGYRVDQARTVAQALEMIQQERYNCVIIETQLPDEDAYEVCRQLRQAREQDKRRTASIILTSSRSTMDRVRGAMAGCDAYLGKPVQSDRLIRALEKFLPNWRMMQ